MSLVAPELGHLEFTTQSKDISGYGRNTIMVLVTVKGSAISSPFNDARGEEDSRVVPGVQARMNQAKGVLSSPVHAGPESR